MNKVESWAAGVSTEKVVVMVTALSARALEEGDDPKARVGVLYEVGENKKTGLPFLRMLVTHEREEVGGKMKLVELEEPKFRTVAAERADGFHYQRLPHLPWVDPTDYMKGGGK